jgi:hypothetical protein
MSIFRRTEPRRIPVPARPVRRAAQVSPMDNTRAVLSPEPGVPMGSIGQLCEPSLDPCGAGPISSEKGARP